MAVWGKRILSSWSVLVDEEHKGAPADAHVLIFTSRLLSSYFVDWCCSIQAAIHEIE